MMNQYRDVESLNAFQELKRKGYSEDYILKILDQKSRDNSHYAMDEWRGFRFYKWATMD